MIMLGKLADRVLARFAPKTDAKAAGALSCWWDNTGEYMDCQGFPAWCCDNNGGKVECLCTG